jgi:GTP cyclohydrolase I
MQEKDDRLQRMADAVKVLLECIGEDPNREGLVSTPTRYAKALLDLTNGYQQDIGTLINRALFDEAHDQIVLVRDIEFASLCEHHLLPFRGKVSLYRLTFCK